jgi:hypothetical protein
MQTIEFGKDGNAADTTIYGWSAPEDGYTWTIGQRSALCTEVPDAPFGFQLEILWSPFVIDTVLAAQSVAISIGGRRIADHVVANPGLETAIFRCPPPRRDETRLLIEFDLPSAAQPSVVAGRQDDRMLALCFRKLRIQRLEAPEAAPPPPPPQADLLAEGDAAVDRHLRGLPTPSGDLALVQEGAPTLDVLFGTGGNATALLREGWSAEEPGGIWSLGPACRLVLPRPAEAALYELQLELDPFIHAGSLEAQRLEIAVNGIALPIMRASARAIVFAALPHALIAAEDGVQISFALPDAARPADISGARDERALAFLFKRLVLTAVPPAAALPARLPAPSADAAAAPATLPDDELMLRFESLGENCEFGLVQRACGVEPLGLLRFASAPLPRLLAALRARFAGMGAADNIAVEISANGREYMIRDAAFGFLYHAWVKLGEHRPAEIAFRETRRVPFLARKLIEDLSAGEKIFVYHGMEKLDVFQARALSRALRVYGPCTLLWVEAADADHKAGFLEWVEDGLMRGFVERFAPTEDAHDVALESWVELCRGAARLIASAN